MTSIRTLMKGHPIVRKVSLHFVPRNRGSRPPPYPSVLSPIQSRPLI